MGTRYEDQPVEQWAGPESLDPTPVWKQYILVALLLFLGLAVVVVFSVLALAPNFVTPPALVPGDRLVLATSDVPAVGATPKLIASPIIDDGRSFWLTQPVKGEIYAIRRAWLYLPNGTERCVIDSMGGPSSAVQRTLVGHCAGAHAPTFSATGRSFEGGLRDLDQYLVSVSGEETLAAQLRALADLPRELAPRRADMPQER